MKPHLVAANRVPYGGGYTITDKLTGVQVYGINLDMVMTKIYAARRANGHPIGIGLEEEVEQWLCEQYPAECEQCDKPRARKLGVMDIIHGTKVLVSHFIHGSKFVDQAEAQRRADICSRCPMNLDVPMPCGAGGICQELIDLVKATVGERATSSDGTLKHCNICGCSLQAAVWYPLESQCKGVSEDQKELFKLIEPCWKQC